MIIFNKYQKYFLYLFTFYYSIIKYKNINYIKILLLNFDFKNCNNEKQLEQISEFINIEMIENQNINHLSISEIESYQLYIKEFYRYRIDKIKYICNE